MYILVYIWKLLGIEPTSDIRAVKRAYAGKLKQTHPEDDPEGYQRLREAYDRAMKEAKGSMQHDEAVSASRTVSMDAASSDSEHKSTATLDTGRSVDGGNVPVVSAVEGESDQWIEAVQTLQEDPFEQTYSRWLFLRGQEGEHVLGSSSAEDFLQRMQDIYTVFADRINPEVWAEWLNTDIMWNAAQYADLSEQVMDYVNEHYFLPMSVWRLLDQAFGWKDVMLASPDDFHARYSEISRYGFQQTYGTESSYSLLLPLSDEERDTYLRLRETAYIALEQLTQVRETQVKRYLYIKESEYIAQFNKLSIELERLLQQAEQDCIDDPDLQRMQIRFYLLKDQQDTVLLYCERYLKGCPHDVEILLTQAHSLLKLKRVSEAECVLEQLLSEDVVSNTTGIQYTEQGLQLQVKLEEARDLYTRVVPQLRLKVFLQRMEDIYHVYSDRIRTEAWSEWLQDDIIWDASHQQELTKRVLAFFNKHYFLPQSVWKQLDQAFGLSSKLELAPDYFKECYPNLVESAFHSAYETELGYSQLVRIPADQIDKYLFIRKSAYLAWLGGQSAQTERKLKQAERIFADDPDLLRIQMQFQWMNGKEESVLAYSIRYLQLCPDDVDVVLIRARMLLKLERIGEAEQVLNELLAELPDQRDGIYLLGQCKLLQHSFDEARQAFEQIYGQDQKDVDALMSVQEAKKGLVEQADWLHRGALKRRLYGKQKHQFLMFLISLVYKTLPILAGVLMLGFMIYWLREYTVVTRVLMLIWLFMCVRWLKQCYGCWKGFRYSL
ncbi:Beta-barrel assembly-enhancing protease [compost metagenome]